MKLKMKEFLQSQLYLGTNTTFELYVEHSIDKTELLLILSQTEVQTYAHTAKFWEYIYERTKHYVHADTEVEYYHYIKSNDSDDPIIRATGLGRLKVFVKGSRPTRRAVKSLYTLEESIKENKEYGGDGLSEDDFYNELARITAELAVSLELVKPTTVDDFTDCLYDHLDKWRTAIFDEGDFK